MQTGSETRSLIAKARDDWFESPEGARATHGEASGNYLRNRLEAAFLAGAKAQSTISAVAITTHCHPDDMGEAELAATKLSLPSPIPNESVAAGDLSIRRREMRRGVEISAYHHIRMDMIDHFRDAPAMMASTRCYLAADVERMFIKHEREHATALSHQGGSDGE